ARHGRRPARRSQPGARQGRRVGRHRLALQPLQRQEPRLMAKQANIRWTVAVMLFFASTLNYLDRQVLSVLAPTIQAELGLDDVDYSFITSSFLLSYTVMYAVSGVLVDRLGTRRCFIWAVGGWSIANVLHAFAKTAMQFSVFQIGRASCRA